MKIFRLDEYIKKLESEIANGKIGWGAIFALIAAIAAFTAAAILIALNMANVVGAVVIWFIGGVFSVGIIIFCVRAKIEIWE